MKNRAARSKTYLLSVAIVLKVSRMNQTLENICPRCGASFACGMQTGQEPCWCSELPVLDIPEDPQAGCYCPACLRQLLQIQPEKSPSS